MVVVQTTPEQDRFSAATRHTYDAITDKQYNEELDKWHDRLYCGVLSKPHAMALAAHLNRNTNETFCWYMT